MSQGPPGYTRMGTFWVAPQMPEQERPAPQPDLDALDVAAFKARLDRAYEGVCRELDDAHLTADRRQYLSGMRHGLAEALRFLDVEGRRPRSAVPAASTETAPD